MKKFLILVFALFCVIYFAQITPANAFDKNICYSNFSKKELLKDLSYSEKETFNKTYKSNSMKERLERLELAVFGAIQYGQEDFRIKKIRKAIAISEEESNPYKNKNSINLAKNTSGITNWAIGNMHNYSQYKPRPHYTSKKYFKNSYPRCHYCRTHRLPPPIPYQQPPNSITNGDLNRNYSIGTSVKILED